MNISICKFAKFIARPFTEKYVWCYVMTSLVRQSSTITIQIFDNKKFRRRDQGLPFQITTVFPATLQLVSRFSGGYQYARHRNHFSRDG